MCLAMILSWTKDRVVAAMKRVSVEAACSIRVVRAYNPSWFSVWCVFVRSVVFLLLVFTCFVLCSTRMCWW